MITLAELGEVVKSDATYQTPEWKKKAIAATSTMGAVAAPVALYQAARGAKENTGGVPRQAVGAASNRLRASGYRAIARSGGTKGNRRLRAGQALGRPVRVLNTRAGRIGTLGALAAGTGMVGLQGAASAGDFLVAHESRKGGSVSKLAAPSSPLAQAATKKAAKKAVRDAYYQAGKEAGLTNRLLPNPTQRKALAYGGAAYLGYKGTKTYRDFKQSQYQPYNGGY